MDRPYLAENDASRARLAAFVDRLSDDDLVRELPGGWTLAAYLAHLAFFDRRAAVLIERWSEHGFAPSPLDYDATNDAMLPAWRLIPPRAAVAEALEAAETADLAVAQASSEFVATVEANPGSIRLDRAHHRDDHLDELEPLFA